MASERLVRDLVILVPDSDTHWTMRGLLGREPASLGFRELDFNVLPHPEKDPGCRLRAPEFLRPLCRQYRHALVMFDREGSGRDSEPREELEKAVERQLTTAWDDRAAAIVLDPELEVWVWSDSPHVETVLGWKGKTPPLRAWLEQQGLWTPGASKPARPKEAVEAAMRKAKKPRSPSRYQDLASQVSIQRCQDPAFAKLLATLRRWFGHPGST